MIYKIKTTRGFTGGDLSIRSSTAHKQGLTSVSPNIFIFCVGRLVTADPMWRCTTLPWRQAGSSPAAVSNPAFFVSGSRGEGSGGVDTCSVVYRAVDARQITPRLSAWQARFQRAPSLPVAQATNSCFGSNHSLSIIVRDATMRRKAEPPRAWTDMPRSKIRARLTSWWLSFCREITVREIRFLRLFDRK